MGNDLKLRKKLLSPPGDTIQETIDELNMSQTELAERMGRSKEKLNDLIKGREPLTRKTALLLERVLGIPMSFWIKRGNEYREELMRIEQEEFLEKCVEWLKQFPVRELKKLGVLPDTRDKHKLADELLRFFRVATPQEWEKIYVKYKVSAAFKVSLKNTKSPHAISAWLRIGEVKAKEMDRAEFSKSKFRKTLKDIKLLAKDQPQDYLQQLRKRCAAAGVAVLFTPNLPKAPISGATWWTGNTPIIQLSGRYKTNDSFWFAFYHEAGHIIEHGKKDIFLEDLKGTENDAQKEEEANLFAQRHLFPREALQELSKQTITHELIAEYAARYEIHPGIITGQLQYTGIIEYSKMNDLKEPIDFDEE